MISFAEQQTKATKDNAFLKKGDIVHCTVTAIKPYSIDVIIKTDDARNCGSIYISRIAKKYIEDIRDEVCIGEIFQAKIDVYKRQRYGRTPPAHGSAAAGHGSCRCHSCAPREPHLSLIHICNPLKLSPDFPPLRTVHAAFTAHGAPSEMNFNGFKHNLHTSSQH